MIELLLGNTGDVRKLLGEPGLEVLDVSEDAWEVRYEVLSGLAFRNIRLARRDIVVDLVNCSFSQCEFLSITSNGHFWGASDKWEDCLFSSVKLTSPISPMNSFRRCTFRDFCFDHYLPYQTLFSECAFQSSSFTSLRARTIVNQTKRNPELDGKTASVVFSDCRFSTVSFEESYFEGVAFENCTFENVTAENCDFSGVESSEKWWSSTSDPFRQFLLKVLSLIGKKCGKGSAAYSAFEKYKADYFSGRTNSKNFSATLYSNEVPYEEVLLVERDLRALVANTSF